MKKIIKLKIMFTTFLAISSIATMLTTNADDTEVFYSVNAAKPNLLFVLDNSGSMNRDVNGVSSDQAAYTGTSRLQILQNAVQSVLQEAPDNVNIGLMRFGPGRNEVTRPFRWGWWSEVYTNIEAKRTHFINGVAFPLTDINALAREVIPTENDVYALPYYPGANETVRDYVSEIVQSWQASGGTPLVDALYEAALYYRGEKMRYGFDIPNGNTAVGAHPSTYSGNTISNDMWRSQRNYDLAPNYISPISSSCQANYIVLMSDGAPTYYYWAEANTQGAT